MRKRILISFSAWFMQVAASPVEKHGFKEAKHIFCQYYEIPNDIINVNTGKPTAFPLRFTTFLLDDKLKPLSMWHPDHEKVDNSIRTRCSEGPMGKGWGMDPVQKLIWSSKDEIYMDSYRKDAVSCFEREMGTTCKKLPMPVAKSDRGYRLKPLGVATITCEYTETNKPDFRQRIYTLVLKDGKGQSLEAGSPAYEYLGMLLKPDSQLDFLIKFPTFEKGLRMSFDYQAKYYNLKDWSWEESERYILYDLDEPIQAAMEDFKPMECKEDEESKATKEKVQENGSDKSKRMARY